MRHLMIKKLKMRNTKSKIKIILIQNVGRIKCHEWN